MSVYLPGKRNFPVIPGGVVLTDRTTGELLRISSEDDWIELTTIHRKFKGPVYGVFEGPVMMLSDGRLYRLLVDDGHLGIEQISYPVWQRRNRVVPVYSQKLGPTFDVFKLDVHSNLVTS